MRRMLCGLAVVAAAITAHGASATCKLGKVAELPIVMAGRQPMVEAKINGHTVRLVLDSGAFYSMLTPGTAAELALHLENAPFGFMVSGVGGELTPDIARIKDFGIVGATLHNIDFLVGGNETGGAGTLGQNILAYKDVEYDLAGGAVRMWESSGCGKANLAYWAKDKAFAMLAIDPISPLHGQTIGTVVVNGVHLRAMFDTGAGTSAMTVAAAARAGVHIKDPGVKSGGMGFGIGRRTHRSWIAPFASFGVGDELIKNTHLRIADFTLGEVDMLVGADFFLSHRVYVSNALRLMFLTYSGGPVFNLREEPADDEPSPGKPVPGGAVATVATIASDPPRPAPASPDDPSDAAGFARRSAVKAARGDSRGALADLDRAVAMAPDEPRYLGQRATLRLHLEQMKGAAEDLDRALALRPDDPELLLPRGELRLVDGDKDGALRNADAADKALAKASDLRLGLAQLYAGLDAFDQAIAQYGLWLAVHPDDVRVPSAYNGRCWARALAARDLPLALADCNAALRRRSGLPAFLDSRGLVELRMGALDKAVADYSRALAGDNDQAWSHYGRGLAALREGRKAEGEADIAAAVAIDPKLPDRARRYGLVPPG